MQTTCLTEHASATDDSPERPSSTPVGKADHSRSAADFDVACLRECILEIHPLIFCCADRSRHLPRVRASLPLGATQSVHTPQIRQLLMGQPHYRLNTATMARLHQTIHPR